MSKQNGKIYRVKSVDHEFLADVSIILQSNKVTVPFPTATDKTYRIWISEDLTKWVLTSNSISGMEIKVNGSILPWAAAGFTGSRGRCPEEEFVGGRT